MGVRSGRRAPSLKRWSYCYCHEALLKTKGLGQAHPRETPVVRTVVLLGS